MYVFVWTLVQIIEKDGKFLLKLVKFLNEKVVEVSSAVLQRIEVFTVKRILQRSKSPIVQCQVNMVDVTELARLAIFFSSGQ